MPSSKRLSFDMDDDGELYCITVTESGFMRIWHDDLADVMSTIGAYTLVGRGLTYDEALCLARINNLGKVYGTDHNN